VGFELPADFLEHCFGSQQDIVIPDPHDTISIHGQLARALYVIAALI
jgi:hypothetical protein